MEDGILGWVEDLDRRSARKPARPKTIVRITRRTILPGERLARRAERQSMTPGANKA